MISPIRRRGVKYRFNNGQRILDLTCADFSRSTGISIARVLDLVKSRTRCLCGTWKSEGYLDSGGNLVPVVFIGNPRRTFSFRKIGSSFILIKTRADMARFLGVQSSLVYREVLKKTGRLPGWLVA